MEGVKNRAGVFYGSIIYLDIFVNEFVCLCVQASVAKLETSVSYVGDMLELKVYGFNEKLPVLLSKVLSAARSFVPTDERYQVSDMLVSIS